jgi:hypothetical protein
VTATYPEGYFPGSETERVELANQARIRDARAEEERVAALPPPEEAPPPIPGLSAGERAELERLRAEQLSETERAELAQLRAGSNRPFGAQNG